MLRKRLESVNNAIEAIEGGAQHYTLNGRTLGRAALFRLYEERDRLEMRISIAANRGRGFIARAKFRSQR